jgi:hypothetical protein
LSTHFKHSLKKKECLKCYYTIDVSVKLAPLCV